mgnify:FL=1
MSQYSNQSPQGEDGTDLLIAAAVVGLGMAAVALFPNPVTTPLVIGKCGYYLGRVMGGRR